MFKKYNLLYVFFLLLISCDTPETPSFYFTKNGLKYEYHDIVTDGVKPKIGDFLNMYMEWRSLSDSVFYSSLNNQLFGIESFRLKSSTIKAGIHEGFLSIMEGDSVTFYVDPVDFFKYYLNSTPPVFMNIDENIKITIRLLSIKDSTEQIDFKKEHFLKLSEKEEYLIEKILVNWNYKYDIVLKYGDVYISPLNTISDPDEENQNYKKTVKVFYSIHLHNGDSIFSNFSDQPHEFDMESENQMLDGFKYVIQQLDSGDHVMALMPSYLCFDSKWGLEGRVPPYSPLIFEIMVVE